MEGQRNCEWFKTFPDDHWLFSEEKAVADGTAAAEHLITHPGMKVFDCPCGDARVSIHLAKKGAIVTGLDLNPRFIKRAKERFAEAGLDGNFYVGDMRNASFPGGCDLFFSWANSFGFFSDEENRFFMQRMADCIRPGGRLVIDNPNLWVVQGPPEPPEENKAIRGDIPYFRYEYDYETNRFDAFEDGRWVFSERMYDLKEYEEMFLNCGLELVETYSEYFTPYDEKKRRMILIAEKK